MQNNLAEDRPTQRRPKEHWMEEYRQANENLRFYGNLRFAQLTLFFVATGVLMGAADPGTGLFAIVGQLGLALGGLVLVAVFAVMEQASVKYWQHYRDRAVHLESRLELKLYSVRPGRSFFNATNATRFLFVAVAIMWAVVAVAPWLERMLRAQ